MKKSLVVIVSVISVLIVMSFVYSVMEISINGNFTRLRDSKQGAIQKFIFAKYFSDNQIQQNPQIIQTGKFEKNINVDGLKRNYIVYIPKNYKENNGAMISFHGGGGNAEQQCKDAKLFESSEKYGYLVVCPDGTSRGFTNLLTWNDKTLPVYAKENNIADVEFTEKIIEDLVKNYKVNSKKIFVSGYSNGGIFAYRLACEIPEKIAGVGIVAASIGENKNCSGNLTVPIIAFHGVNDNSILFNGGSGQNALAPYNHPSFQESINYWVNKNNLSSEPINQELRGNAQNYQYGVNQKVLISAWVLTDGGHTWPGGESTLSENLIGKINRDVSATEEMILFFANYSR